MIGPWTLGALLVAESALKGAVVLVAVWFVGRVLRRKDAALSHLVLLAGLIATLAMPMVSAVAPGPTLWVLRVSAADQVGGANPTLSSSAVRSPRGAKRVPTTVGSSGIDLSAASHPVRLEAAWALPFLVAWLVGVVFVVGRLAFGLCALSALTGRETRESSDGLEELGESVGLRRPWCLRVGTTSTLAGPMTWGIGRPIVLLPADSERWPEERRRSILKHELAHVRRADFLSQIVAELACAASWFNPLAWLVSRELRRSAECAADDIVLRSGVKPSDYASTLLQVAADLRTRRPSHAPMGVSAMSDTKIESRLRAVLSPSARRRGVTSLHVLAVAALAACSVGAMAMLHAKVGGPQVYRAVPGTKTSPVSQTLMNLKHIALATIMLAADEKDTLPYATNTAAAVNAIKPYLKSMADFKTPTRGGKYVFNTNLGGVPFPALDRPAEIPMWVEVLPDKSAPFGVAYADGHVKLCNSAGRAALEKELRIHYPRVKGLKPLPTSTTPQP